MLKSQKLLCFIISIGFLITFKSLSQIPLAQVNQSPLLWNSSLAGAKNKHRIILAYNRTNHENENQLKNYHVSYDQFSKKLKSGLGLYYSYSKKLVDTIDSEITNSLPNSVLGESYQHHLSQSVIGFCIAPKLNVLDKANPNIIRYTFSPSFLLEYNKGSFQVNKDFDSQTYAKTLYSIETPSGGPSKYDSTVTQFFQNTITNHRIKTGFGLQLNSKNVIFLVSIKQVTNHVNESPQYVRHQSPSLETEYRDETWSYQLFSLEESMNLGVSFPLKRKSAFHFTPIVGIGFKQYLNTPANFKDQTDYVNLLENNRSLGLNYAHGSANFKFKKLLFGTAYTHSYKNTYYGAGVGFQNNSIKIMSHWVFGKRQFQEITLSYLI